ncbi:hypothetical protein MTO96_009812 [Rhipicephalus appendiculatus]
MLVLELGTLETTFFSTVMRIRTQNEEVGPAVCLSAYQSFRYGRVERKRSVQQAEASSAWRIAQAQPTTSTQTAIAVSWFADNGGERAKRCSLRGIERRRTRGERFVRGQCFIRPVVGAIG